ncbi:putative 39S ribosomal protein L23, mitochondrial [Hypsibius exemplaris]|uniref:Large ribosomal subunit protein uL23m n=1 Tax=Hypsibius exemplaris TaxID=2072580 RepID=A0A1W0WW05_HYPEX|nr:putative 39S ribosomal protein L23, mitochondrial [Hypsibius exemplaris]
MATKTYPLWRPGNPQLRIFLPDFYMKLVKPERTLPPHIVQFEVDIRMSDTDVKNYLTKIYDVPVVDVRTVVKQGQYFRHPLGHELREPYKRVAFVTLEKNAKFSFPNLFPAIAQQEKKREETQFNDMMEQAKVQRQRHWDRAGAPTWFSA